MSRRTAVSRIVALAIALLASMLLAPAGSQALTIVPESGPLSEIIVNPDLTCQVRYGEEQFYSFFPPASDPNPPRCQTYLVRGTGAAARVFGQFAPNDYIPQFQSDVVSGDGSPGNPYYVSTTVCAGSEVECNEEFTAPWVTTEVRYVNGEDFLRTDVRVGANGLAETIGIYQYGDCYLQESDFGYGYFDPATAGIYCSEVANNADPGGRIEGFVPLTPGSSRTEGQHNDVRLRILNGGGAPLDNLCACDVYQDNAAALAWTGIALPQFGNARRSFLTAFSPPGFPVEPPPAVTLDAPVDGATTEDPVIPFAGTAGTAEGDSPTVVVEVFEGEELPEQFPTDEFEADVGTDGRWSIDGRVDPGTYTARARQSTESGNEGFSAPVTFTVTDTTALALDPAQDSNPVGAQHTVTATLTTNRRGGIEDRPIMFTVTGANPTVPPPEPEWVYTDAEGQATFSYTAANDGVDTITACADLDFADFATEGIGVLGFGECDPDEPTATATKLWFLPDTTITGGPAGPTNDNTPTFAFESDPEGATFECAVDIANFVPCESSHTTAQLGEGPHTFRVRAVNAFGYADETPASRAFVVDTTAPQTTITSGPSGPTNDTTPTFLFSSETGATFQCRVDADDFAPCDAPSYTPDVLGEGPHTFEVRARDAAGNTDGSPAIRSFVVDTTGPATTITSGPAGPTNDATPTFAFESEASASFECRVDTAEFAPCTSPHTTAALAEGPHTFQVRATDAVGNTGPVASRSFVRDATAPETQILFPAAGATSSRPVFVFSAGEPGSTFECRIDGGDFEPCTSPYLSDASLADGPHTFEVRATDAAGNVGPVQSRPFVRDATPPDATIASGPAGSVEDPQPAFEFSSSEPGSTFECSVDGGDFESCTSPFTTPALPLGEHTFAVRARDAAGNTSAPVSRSFTVVPATVPPPAPPPGPASGSTPPPPPPPPPSATSSTATTPTPTAGDRDGDGIPDAQDTCPDALDPNQADSDEDDIGNACENSEASGGPVLGQAVVGRVVSGAVFVKTPASGLRGGARAAQAGSTNPPAGYVRLRGAELLPVGTIVHALRGRLALTSAAGARRGQRQTSDFYKGTFRIRQARTRLRPVTDVLLRSLDFGRVCGSGSQPASAGSAGAAQAAQAGGFAFVQKKRSKRVVSRLWGNGKGRFRTKGRQSAATVRGTKWLTQERCDGTLTYVASGSVSVRDLRRKKTVIVRAGRAYLARRP